MSKALYLVTEAPGAYIHGAGLIVPGQYFEAPDDKYVPSRKFRALNEPAAAALKVLQESMLAKAKEYRKLSESSALTPSRREAYLDAAEHIEDEAKSMDIEVKDKPGPRVKADPRVSLSELDQSLRGSKKHEKRASDT